MAIEEHGLDAGEDGVGAIEVTPSGLDHADGRVGEEVDGLAEHVRRGDEIGIEDEDEIAFAALHSGFEGAGFETGTVGAMDELDIEAGGAQFGDLFGGDFSGFVGGIVEDLDLEEVTRVIEGGDGSEEALDDVQFVENRQLDRDSWQVVESRARLRRFMPIFQEKIDDNVAMQAVESQAEKDCEIANCPNCVSQASVHNEFWPFPAE
jgi:hypothetical protein